MFFFCFQIPRIKHTIAYIAFNTTINNTINCKIDGFKTIGFRTKRALVINHMFLFFANIVKKSNPQNVSADFFQKKVSQLVYSSPYFLHITKNPTDSNNLVCDFIMSLANEHLKGKCLNDVKKLVEGWVKTSEQFFEIEKESFVLTEEAEQSLFRAILGRTPTQLCRFSSFRSVFRILKNGKLYLNNIMNMNDKTEGAYYDSYLSGPDKNTDVSANMIEYFIMSCSDTKKASDFDMWRLYGNDTKGCCILFSYNKSKSYDFKIFPISYARKDGKHPEVEFINNLVTKALDRGERIVIKRLDEWKLFFKPYEYHNEKEIRILRSYGQNTNGFEEEYFINEQYGIASKSLAFGFNDFPLKLDKIILGPGLPEKEANMAMFEELLRKSITDKKILVSYFDCKPYRV